MLKIYGIKNCSSMKKAFDLLNELNLPYEFHDYKKQGIDAESIQKWLEQAGQDVILNKKGTTWKKLTEQEQQHALSSEAALIETLMTHSSIIKRPVLETEQGLLVGFDEAAYRKLSA
ncbi:Spx/MgsR family RNA polymerase-binding regulatory protein [Acinetobacter chinensis]|uniref:Spx/MgsR family RNA polymerase-binding regulatory protein n=1 Tax=Acinetobacter chinensis TaxID=2004650 RepID=A0A3B7LZ31_9GAMM|nr:Spx/MgsR family RNA polymerase-binding regulatory protein [Acinetobacter chinensis]AXY58180.1 Spx/MgsR family RNA polymerase-binding regulatory protein [Acinetobacter chinensis]